MTEPAASKDHRPWDADGHPEASSDPAAGSSGLIVERPRASTVAAPGLPEPLVVGVLEAAPDAMLVVDGGGIIRLLNAQTERMFGYRRDELMGQPVETLVPERFRPVHVQHRTKFAAAPRIRPINTGTVQIARRKDGGEFPSDISLSPLFAEGEALVIAAVRDITDRCEAEAALRESEERFRVALKHASIVVSHQDGDLRYTWVHNPHPWFSAEAVLGKTDAELMPLDEGARLTEIKRRVLETGRGARAEVRTTVGGVAYHYDLSVEPLYDADGRVTGITCASLDVTERVRAEAARLQLAEEQATHAGAERERAFVSAVLDTVGALVVLLDRQGRVVRFNRACEELTGYTFDEVRGRPLWDFLLIPEEVEPVKAVFERLRAGQFPSRHENCWLTRDGGRRWIAWSNSALLDARGEVEHVIGTGIDITERRQAEAQLRKLSRAVESSANTIIITDARGNIEYVNPKFTQITGYASDEVVGRNPRLLKSGRTPPEEYERLWTTIKAGGEWRGEFLNRKKNGEWYWESASISPIAGLDGAITHFVAVKEDITDRKRAERALREASQRLESHVEHSGLAVVEWDADFVVTRWAGQAERMFGWSAAETVGKAIADLHMVYEPDIPHVGQVMEKLTDGVTRTVISENRNVTKDGRVIHCTWYNSVLLDEQGQMASVLSLVLDRTERVQAEQALREARDDLNRAQAVAHTGSWRLDVRRDELLWSDETHRIFGIPKGTRLTYEAFLATVLLEDRDHVDRAWSAALCGEPYDVEHRILVDGQVKWVRQRAELEFDSQGVLKGGFGSAQDITERKRSEAALRESEERYRRLVELSPDAIVVHSGGRVVFANPATARLLRVASADALIGAPVMDFVSDEYREIVVERIRHALATGLDIVLLEEQFIRADGTRVDVEVSGIPLYYREQPAVQLVVRDISERKRAAAALAAEKERLAVTLRSIGDAVIASDTDGRVVLMNPVAEALTGWPASEALGRAVAEVFHIVNDRSHQPIEDPVAVVLRGGGVVGLANHTLLIARDGTSRAIADSGAPIHDEAGQVLGVVLVFQDVTGKQRLDAELAKANKLDALGVLAGGVAHDFNNILTAILANTSLTKMTVAQGSKPHQWLTEVEKASRRAKDLTQQLLTFAKGGAPVRQLASLDDLVRDSATFALRGSNVQPVFDLADDLWPAEVDPGQISQVIQNLVLNAQQAMPQGGAVRVSADNTTLGPDQGLPLAAGRYLKIGVADRGTGIHPEHLPRIFDPFFTTKQTGSGLGLATSYAIVQKHGGHITVESVLGQGTTVAVYLPAAEGALPAPESPAGQVMVGQGHILVMDDEESVREVLREVLTRTGYRVVLCADGPQAIAEYRRARDAGEPFDAVVLDLTVPGGMGGRQVLDALRQLDPAVRAIASSGYSTDPIMSDFRAHGFAGVVAKPYTAEEVGRVMRAVASSQ